ncbi:hypothetical protein GCM10009763_21590 [Dermacoccus profundi]|uniref:Uncharacterized protein n=1 Tax=Dermacoccus profundi TaxID=322602 RepID=A0ABN2DAL5_9MICO
MSPLWLRIDGAFSRPVADPGAPTWRSSNPKVDDTCAHDDGAAALWVRESMRRVSDVATVVGYVARASSALPAQKGTSLSFAPSGVVSGRKFCSDSHPQGALERGTVAVRNRMRVRRERRDHL